MATEKRDAPRGIVGVKDGVDPLRFSHGRYLPSAQTAPWIEHHWSVAWAMAPGTTQARHTLSHPSVHVAFDGARATVTGPTRGRYTWVLAGEGRVVATKFLPGAFRAVAAMPMRSLVDAVVDLGDVVDAAVAAAYVAAARADAVEAAVDAVDAFWARVLRVPAADHDLVQAIVSRVQSDRSLTRVDELVRHTGLHLRELQRVCDEALGISPRWLIRRYRLHEALAVLDAAVDATDDRHADHAGRAALAAVAADLGYADHAHFSRDFKAVVGVSPSAYRRLVASAPRH